MHRGEVLRSVVVMEGGSERRHRDAGADVPGRGAGRARGHGEPSAGRWHLGGRQQRLAGRRRQRGARDRRRARRRTRSSTRSTGAGSSRSCAPTGTTTTSTPRPSWSRRPAPRSFLHPDDRVLWDQTPDRGARRPSCSDGQVVHRRWRRADRAAHAGPRAGCAAACTRRRWGSLFSGDTLFHGGPGATGRSFSDFPTIIDVDPRPAADLPPHTVVLHRPRRRHHHRRRGAAPAGLDRPRLLTGAWFEVIRWYLGPEHHLDPPGVAAVEVIRRSLGPEHHLEPPATGRRRGRGRPWVRGWVRRR